MITEFYITHFTDLDLKEIALDIFGNRIFTDRHCADRRDVQSVFMALNFLSQEQLDELQAADVGLLDAMPIGGEPHADPA